MTRDSDEPILRRIESAFSNFAEHRTLALWTLFFCVICIRVAILPWLGIPIVRFQDEASYLLIGDTFAHGRLTNPTHPMWRSFEAFHVNWFPTYSSMYPPAQGLVLGIGQLLGHPWIGVLLTVAAMCAAIMWMLQAWMPPRWALLGGILSALKFGFASYWMNSYWGGAVAAIGGAMVLGALPRVFRRVNAWHVVILGLGAAILANSRSYEGFLFCVPAAAWFLWRLRVEIKSGSMPAGQTKTILAPLLVVLMTTALFMGYYNWKLTGDALLMPHVLRYRTYHSSAIFLWQHLRPELHYNNQQFEDFYNGWERGNYHSTWADVMRVSTEKLFRYGTAFFWWGALLLLPGLPFALRDRKMRLPAVTFVIGIIGLFALIWSFPHYAAPFTCLVIAFLVQSTRHIRTVYVAGWALGKWLSRISILLLAMNTAGYVAYRACDPLLWACEGDARRVVVQNRLSHMPGKHIVIVRYKRGHPVHNEWVYNGADIDTAKVLWARELDNAQNAKLISYFKDRHIWLVEPDNGNIDLKPYSPPEP